MRVLFPKAGRRWWPVLLAAALVCLCGTFALLYLVERPETACGLFAGAFVGAYVLVDKVIGCLVMPPDYEPRDFSRFPDKRGATASLERRFKVLAERWKEDTWFMSNAANMAAHPAYREIVGMGERAIPMILAEMRSDPDHWFYALNGIVGIDVTRPEHAGNVTAMTRDWLDWGQANGYL